MICSNQNCQGQLKVTNTYTLASAKYQRAVCTVCKRVHTLHTVVEAVAAPRGAGAKALAKRAAQAMLLAGAMLFASCRTPQESQIVIEALTYSFDEVKLCRVTAALMEQAPLNEAVIVTVSAMDGLFWGQSWYDPDQKAYRIAIEAEQPMAMVLDTLLHEWAHLIVHGVPGEGAHDSLWGVSYARCYRIALTAQFGPEASEKPREGRTLESVRATPGPVGASAGTPLSRR